MRLQKTTIFFQKQSQTIINRQKNDTYDNLQLKSSHVSPNFFFYYLIICAHRALPIEINVFESTPICTPRFPAEI